ncbi:hypothetical protein JD79_03586 [Geodermatophilus normandii]|uniref:Uncharacterized protein n=1 Tax=Geodermatophilus normandii TaxID=1137989 RepID=A0A317QNI6_9ACTN|nr:hypothetical protein [Geodermatophilus normandii]PWW24407.1 hypothetical protein JD79_03586 [Geodermatophilus normandii]
MTMTEGTLRPDALAVRDGRLTVAVHLPWYRSLPVSCLESLDVTVDGAPVAVRALAVGGFTGSLADAAASAAWWDLRDTLDAALDTAGTPGAAHVVEVALAVRIPYIQQAPGVPLVQRATVRTEATAR